MATGRTSPVGKRQWFEADRSPSSVEIKNVWSCTSTPIHTSQLYLTIHAGKSKPGSSAVQRIA
jgi:hypothetical protein